MHRPNPTVFFFPGLSSRPWHDPADFSWCREMEKNVPGIRAEYDNLVHRKVGARLTASSSYKRVEGGVEQVKWRVWNRQPIRFGVFSSVDYPRLYVGAG